MVPIRLAVDKLFGVFDHEIAFKTVDHVTIVLAPNGLGKTVLLKMLDALANGPMEVFARTPFERFRLLFDNDISIEIRKEELRKPETGIGSSLASYLGEGKLSTQPIASGICVEIVT